MRRLIRSKARPKKRLVEVVVTLDNHEGDTYQEHLAIPEGATIGVDQIYPDVVIRDSDGQITRAIDWRAGFSESYEFLYEEIEK